jgi:hypothetical protein
MMNKVTRHAPWMTASGAVAQVLGLAWDARLHRLHPDLGSHEGIFTFANPGHALIAVGMALVVAGTALFLWARGAGTTAGSRWRSVAGPASAIAVVALALTAFGSAAVTEARHRHTHAEEAAPTPGQLVAASEFLKATKTGIARFADFRVAQAEGYWQVTPFPLNGKYGPAHFHNDDYARAAYVHPGQVDPQHPPDLVYLKLPDDRMLLLGAMYVASKGMGPRIGGPLAVWHSHASLCFGSAGAVLSKTPGQCPPGAQFVGDRVEMLHVWVFDNPDGAFAHGLTRTSVRAAIKQLSNGH